MMKFRSCLLALGIAITGYTAHAQAVAAATQPAPLQVGGGISYGSTDIYKKDVTGVTIYATYDFTYHLGVEATAHMMWVNTPDDFLESSYLIGPRYAWHYRRYHPYVKILVGIGHAAASSDRPDIRFVQNQAIPASKFAYAGGGGIDVSFSHHLNVRGDLDYQRWPGFQPHGLTPYVATIGIAYRFR